MKALTLLPLLLFLAACQSSNPYTQQSAGLPPAPAVTTPRIDTTAYPAAPLDYSAFRSWTWGPALASGNGWTPELLREAVANGLDQRGLRPATSGPGDLQVSASLRTEKRLRQVYDDYPRGYAGYGNGPYWGDRYGYGASVPITRTYEIEVGVLSLDFRDTRGQLVWTGSADLSMSGDSASQRRDALYAAVHSALNNYPPR